jgi:hypothetical protein
VEKCNEDRFDRCGFEGTIASLCFGDVGDDDDATNGEESMELGVPGEDPLSDDDAGLDGSRGGTVSVCVSRCWRWVAGRRWTCEDTATADRLS